MYTGSAAYDLYRVTESTAAPQLQPQGLPEEQYIPQRHRRVKAKAAVAPFGVLGLLVAACMMVLVIAGYVQLYEATQNVSDLQSELSDLQAEQAVLESVYEGSIDLSEIELRAAELGLATPNREQTVYINLSGSDRAEISTYEEVGFFGRIFRAIRSSAGGLVEYLS
jgi:hypothetical protein